MVSAGDTLAHRKYEQLQPDRAAQYDEILQKLAERGDHSGAELFRRNMIKFETSDAVALGADPTTAYVGHCTSSLFETLRGMGFSESLLDSVCVGSTLQDDVAAEMRRFPDGSGLVLISDSILTLGSLLSTFLGDVMYRIGRGPAPLTAWRSLKVAVTGKLPVSTEHLVALLRYHNLQQRVFGTAAKLGQELNSDRAAMGMFVGLLASKFVIAHELAHHVLGHSAQVSAFSALSDLPACSPDQRLELDADALALDILLNSAEKHQDGSDLPLPPGVMLAGALVSIVTVHCAEQAMFVRGGATHPPAAVRAAALLARASFSDQRFADLWLRQLVTATDSAASFGPGAALIDLDSLYANPRIDSPLDRSYLQGVRKLDKVQCTAAKDLAGGFPEINKLHECRLAAGGKAALAGRAEDALASWGVADPDRARILQSDRPLSFHSLLNSIRSGPRPQIELERDIALMCSLAAATVVAPLLVKEGSTSD